MRILQINVRLDSGSVGRIVRDLYKGLKNEGHECKIAYARGNNDFIPEEDTIRICSEFEVRKHALLTRLFGRTAFYSHRSTKRFLKWIDEYKPDIIHIHGVYGYYINMKDLFEYFAKKNIKVVSTLHSCWDFTGHCCYFDYIECRKWLEACEKCPQKDSYPESSFLDNTKWNYMQKRELYQGLKNCIIVTPSKWLEKYVRQSFLSIHRCLTIENGVDIDIFRKLAKQEITICSKYGISTNKPLILAVANIWDRRKGYDDICELVRLPEASELELVIVGLTKKQKRKLEHAMPMSNNIICIERTKNVEELVQLYNVATMLFNPTYEDNYPTVNLEAIACGTPVVTYNTGGSPEAVRQYNMGEIIEKKDYQSVISLAVAYYQKGKSNAVGSEQRRELSFSRMTDAYLGVYKAI